MSLRIAFLTGSPYAQASGVNVVVQCLARELASDGQEVCVFGRLDPQATASDPAGWDGVQVQCFAQRGPAKFGYCGGMYAAVAAFKPDIIHLHGIWTYTSVVAARLKKATGARLVISPHGSLAPAAMNQSRLKKNLAMALFQRSCFAVADGFHVTADAEVTDLTGHVGNQKVAIIRNGVEPPAAAPTPYHNRQNKILALCRMEPKKGLETLIDAWAIVAAERPDWCLEIRGPDRQNYRLELARLIAARGVQNVHIEHGVYGQERDAAIGSSKLFILPSKNENFGMTAAEALGLQTPLIASTGTPWSSVVDHGCGWWVKADTAGLVEALRLATATDTDTLAAMGQRGKGWMDQSFRWNDVAQDFLTFYQSLQAAAKTGHSGGQA